MNCFNIPHHCDPHLNQTKLNGLLPLTIPGVLDTGYQKSESIHRIFIRVVMINNESTYETVTDLHDIYSEHSDDTAE